MTAGARNARGKGGITATRVFRVVVNSATDGPRAARLASGIPAYYSAHNADPAALAVNIDPGEATTEGDRLVYTVRVDYETPTLTGGVADSPWDDPVKVHFGFQAINRVIVVDRAGVPITNSAVDQFDPPPTRDFRMQTVQIVRNESSFDPDAAEYYIDIVNSDTVTIAGKTVAPYAALMMDLNGERDVRNGVSFYRVTYDILFALPSWKYPIPANAAAAGGTHWLVLLDQGFNYLDDDAKWQRVSVGGAPAEVPAKLNGSGGRLDDNLTGIYLKFEHYPAAPFSGLALNV